MPRDGLQQYAPPPGTNGITNYTIESTKYNGFVADVTQDLNLPRPIVAGGTGATTATQAITNLGGEVANQLVANYDSFPFVAGSFYSLPGATAEPVAGQYFSGVCYVVNANNMYLEGRASTSLTPQQRWVRSRYGGAWGSWELQAGSAASVDLSYVKKAGDTMTGELNLKASTGLTKLTMNDVGTSTSTSTISLSNTTFKIENNVMPIVLNANTNGGNTSQLILGANGTVSTGSNFTTNNNVYSGYGTAGTGGYYFGNDGTKSLTCNGTSFTLTGGTLTTSAGITANGVILSQISGGTQGSFYFGNTSASYLTFDGSRYFFVGGGVNMGIGTNPGSYNSAFHNVAAQWPFGISGVDRGILYLATSASNLYAFFCQGTTANNVGAISGSSTTTSYVTASSGEMKEDLKSFDAGQIIDATKVYDFAWKSTGERSYGVIAQQAVDVYPLAVTHLEKVSDEIGEFWGVDYSKYVPVLLQELKALRARVAALEGGPPLVGAKPA
jgi:hypothetical protein